jgi:predicted DNA binding CopG/RHH family protein
MVEYIIKKIPITILVWLIKSKFGNKDLKTFTRLLDSNDWKKVNYKSPEKWIFNQDNSFVIEEGDSVKDFTEKWTQNFPDQFGSKQKEVYLKISSELIEKPLTFISLDGGRYFVPMPKLDRAYNKTYYYWDRDSIEYKVFKIIGFLNGADIKDDNKFNTFAEWCGAIIK